MTAWRMGLIVELEANDIDEAQEIGERIWTTCAPLVKEAGARWLLPVGDFEEREPFPTKAQA